MTKTLEKRIYLTRRAADMWVHIIHSLFVGKTAVVVVVHEGRDYCPEVKIEKIENIKTTFDHTIASEMDGRDSWISIKTDWGIYCTVIDLSLDADERSLRVKVLTDSGHKAWWTFKVIDPKGESYRVFHKAMEESWKIPNES